MTLEEAIKMAEMYVDAHTYKKRMNEGARNYRRNMSEDVRLGGMREILKHLKDYQELKK